MAQDTGNFPEDLERSIHLLRYRTPAFLDAPQQPREIRGRIRKGRREQFHVILFNRWTELNRLFLSFNKDLLFLDERALGDDDMEIPLDEGLTGKAGPFCKFLFRKKPPVFLDIEFCPAGLDEDDTFAAFSLSPADNVDVQPGPLGRIENGRAPFNVNLAVTGKECYGA